MVSPGLLVKQLFVGQCLFENSQIHFWVPRRTLISRSLRYPSKVALTRTIAEGVKESRNQWLSMPNFQLSVLIAVHLTVKLRASRLTRKRGIRATEEAILNQVRTNKTTLLLGLSLTTFCFR